MGWDFTKGASMADIVAQCVKPWVSVGGDRHYVLAQHCQRFRLWTVRHIIRADGTQEVYIAVDLLRRERGYGWGHKGMTAAMHPFYYDCPLRFLDMTPPECEDWRNGVREYWRQDAARRARLATLRVGDSVALTGARIPAVRVVSLTPLIGEYAGRRYRIPASLLSVA